MLVDGTISGYGIIFNGMLKDPYFAQVNYTESQLALPGAIQACLFVTSSEYLLLPSPPADHSNGPYAHWLIVVGF
ncbi:unnamed protein product [Schistocephalus solidus]|uniref:Dirigent protein n=1 Tax=Schistocephalus solidus TaxID=70667 RepID=A0A183T738_SCHSO|nr:unnamed protein product [Schistocephalus solidus]